MGVGSEVSEAQARPSVSLYRLDADPDVGFLVPSPAPSLPACSYTPHHDDNELHFWT